MIIELGAQDERKGISKTCIKKHLCLFLKQINSCVRFSDLNHQDGFLKETVSTAFNKNTECQTEVTFFRKMFDYNLTWMEYLAHRHREVPFGFKILWNGCVVSRMDPPVGVEIINSGGVWSATCQHRGPTGGTHSLLCCKNTFKQVLNNQIN